MDLEEITEKICLTQRESGDVLQVVDDSNRHAAVGNVVPVGQPESVTANSLETSLTTDGQKSITVVTANLKRIKFYY